MKQYSRLIKICLVLITFILLKINSRAQISIDLKHNLNRSNPNYIHDKVTFMWLDSQNEPVSNEAINELKMWALKNKIDPQKIMKNQYLFKILENKKLNLEDRIWIADFFIKASESDSSYPIIYLKQVKNFLISTKK